MKKIKNYIKRFFTTTNGINMNAGMKKHYIAILLILICIVSTTHAYAQWVYQKMGPGQAAWTNSDDGTSVVVRLGEAAPDGTPAPIAYGPTDEEETVTDAQNMNEQIMQTNEATQTTQANAATQISTQTDVAASASNAPTNESSSAPVPSIAITQENVAENTGLVLMGNIVLSGGRYLDITKPMVALTYDDGPHSTYGNQIMDVLEKYSGRATFFLVGKRVASNIEVVQRMVADGMEVANHSYSHKYFNKISAQQMLTEIAACNAVIAEATGVTPTLFRLPGGNINSTVKATVNMPMIYWSIDTRDWSHRNSQKTISSIVGKVKDGDIVLMHEIHAATVAAQEAICSALTSQGFQLVTVSELIRYRGYTLETGVQYKSFPIK